MSAIMNFAIFPLDKGAHIGEYVSQIVSYIKESRLRYEFSPMGTVVEADTIPELLDVIKRSYEILDPISDRVYCNISMDNNKLKNDLIQGKRAAIEKRIGKV
ncbi:thiamine-binding protein [Cyclobacteriaceae bacterium]|nr:thiamine-binding protein [Cyclobacteriaceae bacterium]